jgi:4-hydroxybenzoate polyprenyltransferase
VPLNNLPAYLKERFPPAAYGVLVALFFSSSVLVAHGLGGGETTAWSGAAVVLLTFFHLRVFDEHKDAKEDARAYPERVLSRGLVTLAELRVLGGLAIVTQFGLAIWIGSWAVWAWVGTYLFTLLMAKEFFVPTLLKPRIVLYAITHNPVVAGLALFGWACTDAAWDHGFLAYVAMVSLGSLGFEIGRKFRLPDEEIEGVESYTSALGRFRAMALLGFVVVATVGALGATLWLLGAGPWTGLALLAAAPAALIRPAAKAKQVELGSTLVLLLGMLISGGVAWLL